jgi:hypothetical protein
MVFPFWLLADVMDVDGGSGSEQDHDDQPGKDE